MAIGAAAILLLLGWKLDSLLHVWAQSIIEAERAAATKRHEEWLGSAKTELVTVRDGLIAFQRERRTELDAISTAGTEAAESIRANKTKSEADQTVLLEHLRTAVSTAQQSANDLAYQRGVLNDLQAAAVAVTRRDASAIREQLLGNDQFLVGMREAIKAAPPMPVGTVVGSVLDPPAFAKVVDQAHVCANPGEAITPDIRWVLARGQRLPTDSGLSKALRVEEGHEAFVADLRAMFLRGVNYQRADEFKDPDGERSAGTPQPHLLANHRHALTVGEDLYGQGSHGGGGFTGSDTGRAKPLSVGVGGLPGAEGTRAVETRPSNVAVYFYMRVN
jgi:hypothetical protein